MKKIALIALLALGGSISANAQYSVFGDSFKPNKVTDAAALTVETEAKEIEVKGEVESVCQVKGCWMKIKLADGNTMRVTFKDYGFFVPKDLSGSSVIFKGTPSVNVTSVEDQKHYAKDAGKSQAEIDQITEPKEELTFEATGVLVPAAF
ncbi:DUF4920 domain-containing protein [Jiulongibacter sp. NS-SX5]|uniref:DUF4920 domain-containing protein n=1 Tax=Jiulongibacter sp. NS-SX5 TaxID=3463854 RepID=UPI0040594FF7